MKGKMILQKLNILNQCKEYNLPFWQCPQVLFLIMGLIIVLMILISYAVSNHYFDNPQTVVLVISVLTIVLLIIDFIITRSFERLAEANRMKTEFISIVSHQLRSPLSNLKWTIELLMSGKLGKIEKKQLDYFKIIKENSDRMRELVSDLLIVSRIETANLPFRKKEFSLVEMTQEIIKEFELFARASNVKIRLITEKNLPKIISDPEKIEVVIKNLIDNAIRYIKKKGEVLVRLKKKNQSICFEVKDNGVGIPERDQRYIFRKFFRSENVMKYQTQGSGLGLYIAKAIINMLGGKIGFKSQEGKGSTFWFIIPIK